MSRAPLVCLAALSVVVVLTACSSSAKPPAPTSTTQAPVSTTEPSTTSAPAATTTPSSVKILSLTGPPSPVTCNAPTQVQLHWTTRGAQTVELRIDGGPVFSTYPDGKREPLVPLSCDGNTHTYELTARAANGDTATRSLALAERGLVT